MKECQRGKILKARCKSRVKDFNGKVENKNEWVSTIERLND